MAASDKPLEFAFHEAPKPRPPRILRRVTQLHYNPTDKMVVLCLVPEPKTPQLYHLFQVSPQALRAGDEYSPAFKCLVHKRKRRCSLKLSKFSTTELNLDFGRLHVNPGRKRARIDQSHPGIGTRLDSCTLLLSIRLMWSRRHGARLGQPGDASHFA